MVYFDTLICPFSAKSLLRLHDFLLTQLFFQSLRNLGRQIFRFSWPNFSVQSNFFANKLHRGGGFAFPSLFQKTKIMRYEKMLGEGKNLWTFSSLMRFVWMPGCHIPQGVRLSIIFFSKGYWFLGIFLLCSLLAQVCQEIVS